MEDLKTLHDQSLQAAGQAKKAVERNSMMLQQKIAERTKLLSQLEQAKMQEQAANSLRQMTELSAPGSTPSLEDVRDKIERRYANAIGQAELAQNSVQGRMLEVQESTIDMAGRTAWSRSAPRCGALRSRARSRRASPPRSPRRPRPRRTRRPPARCSSPARTDPHARSPSIPRVGGVRASCRARPDRAKAAFARLIRAKAAFARRR